MASGKIGAIVPYFHGFRLHGVGSQFRLPRMIKNGSYPRLSAFGAKFPALFRYKWSLGLAVAVLFTVAASGAPDQLNVDEQYIRIMATIDRADALRKAGQLDAARAKYIEAKTNLMAFKAQNPLFDPTAVKYRLNEVSERVETTKPAQSAAAAKALTDAETPIAKSPVKLVDAGAEPRSVLRFHPKAGDKQDIIMTVKTSMDTGVTNVPPVSIPAMTIPMDLTVKSVGANGDITYEMVVGDVGMAEDTNTPPQVAETLKAALSGFKGVTVLGVMSDRGINKKTEVKSTGSTNPQMQQALEGVKEGLANADSPFPDEAVGAGAKWEYKKSSKLQGGISGENMASYQLLTADGEHITTSVVTTQNANRQGIQIAGSGNGTNTLDLSKVIALQATVSSHVELGTTDGKKAPMIMDTTVQMQAK